MTEAGTLEDLRHNIDGLDFAVGKSMRYHVYRRSFWAGWERLNKIFTGLTGIAVVVTWLADKPDLAAILAGAVAVFSLLDLVLDFGRRAREYDMLYRRFSGVAQKLVAMRDEPTAKALADARRERIEIEMEEPGTIDWLERRCAAEEALARGLEPDGAWKLQRWQLMLSQFAVWPAVPHLTR